MKQIEIVTKKDHAEFILKNDMGDTEMQLIMKEITAEELIRRRIEENPGMVYKKGKKLYYTDAISKDFKLTGKEVNAKTSRCGAGCKHVCGNCPRAFSFSTSYQMKNIMDTQNFFLQPRKVRILAVRESWRLEKYLFITEGLETFNMESGHDMCFVMACKMYEEGRDMADSRLAADLDAYARGKISDFSCHPNEITAIVDRNEAIRNSRQNQKERPKVFEGSSMWRLRNN